MYREQLAAIEAELGHRLDEADAFKIMMERVRDCREGLSTPAQISVSHCGRGWQNGAGFRAELDAAQIACAACDGEMLGSVDGERKKPTLSKRKRARILVRDRHRCAVPGCRSAKNIDIHHIRHQDDGGGHEGWNLIALCSGHHTAHHRGDLRIEGRAPGAVVFEWMHRAHVGSNEPQRAHVGSNASPDRTDHGTNVNRVGPSTFGIVALRTQARDALVGLGWKIAIASAAVQEACGHVGADATIDLLIREALRRCPKPTGSS